MKVLLLNSPKKDKKYRAVFYDKEKEHIFFTDFGAKGMEDFTTHKNEERKNRFQSRFRKLINKHKDDPTKPITLSNMVLWNKPSLRASWNDYKKHFNLK